MVGERGCVLIHAVKQQPKQRNLGRSVDVWNSGERTETSSDKL